MSTPGWNLTGYHYSSQSISLLCTFFVGDEISVRLHWKLCNYALGNLVIDIMCKVYWVKGMVADARKKFTEDRNILQYELQVDDRSTVEKAALHYPARSPAAEGY